MYVYCGILPEIVLESLIDFVAQPNFVGLLKISFLQ